MPKFLYDPDDKRSYEEQYRDWQIVMDTRELDITTYPGSAAEQCSQAQTHRVVTKRDNK